MPPISKNGIKKPRIIKAIISNEVKNHSNDPFFVTKAEASKKVMKKYSLPDTFTNNITIVETMRDYSQEPVFKESAERAKAFLKKHPLPEAEVSKKKSK